MLNNSFLVSSYILLCYFKLEVFLEFYSSPIMVTPKLCPFSVIVSTFYTSTMIYLPEKKATTFLKCISDSH